MKGREFLSTLAPTNSRRRNWHPVDGRKNSVEESGCGRGRTDACIIYPCVYPLARCQRSQLPLFQDFYNWGEAVSRINAPTEGRVGQLFNGIVITRCQAVVLPCALSLIPFLPHPRISHFCHLLLFYRPILRIFCFLSRWSLLACRSSRYVLVFSFLSSFRLRYSAFCS